MPHKQGERWRATVMVDGRRYQGIFDTKGEAKRWEQEKKHEIQNQRQTQQDMELRIFCSKYLDHAEMRFATKVYKEKRSLVHKIISAWGKHTPVDEITVQMVADYLDTRARKKSNNASNKDRKNLLAMWHWGVKMFDLKHNPVSKVSVLSHDRKPQYTPPEKNVLAVLAAAGREERIFLDAYLQTAARRSEIFRWTWAEDINFKRREVRLGTRKTKDGSMAYEWLPMNDALHDSLMWLWNNRKFKETPYVFVCTQPGPHYGKRYTTRRRFLKGLCERAKVRPFGFHALRRYVASILADTHKVSAKTIQRILRHKNVMTTERYIQNINHDLKEVLALLDRRCVPEQSHDLPQPNSTPSQEN